MCLYLTFFWSIISYVLYSIPLFPSISLWVPFALNLLYLNLIIHFVCSCFPVPSPTLQPFLQISNASDTDLQKLVDGDSSTCVALPIVRSQTCPQYPPMLRLFLHRKTRDCSVTPSFSVSLAGTDFKCRDEDDIMIAASHTTFSSGRLNLCSRRFSNTTNCTYNCQLHSNTCSVYIQIIQMNRVMSICDIELF